MDVEKTCYTCLKRENNDLINLLVVDDDNISYLDKLSTCISSELTYEKYMKICSVCVLQLKDAFKFITMVKITQESVGIIESPDAESTGVDLDDLQTEQNQYKIEIDNSDVIFSNDSTIENKDSRKTKSKKSDDNKLYNCEMCNQRFDKKWKAQRHCKRIHLAEKQYVCTYCNKAFKQRYHLREHITIHTGDKSYMCNICDKSFPRSSSLGRHMRSHEKPHGQKSKRKPFLCPICGKKFDFENGGERHMRIHLGIKKFECHVCNRKFTQSTHLIVHMRTHTGEKPFICDTCGEAFSLNAGLQNHMKWHRNDKSLEGVKIG